MKKNIFKTLAVTVLSAVSLTAWAVGTQVTKASVICQQYSYIYANGEDDLPVAITNITLADAQAFGAAVSCPTDYWIVVYATDGDNLKWTSNRKTGEQTTTPEIINAWNTLMMTDAFDVGDDPVTDVTVYLSQGLTPYASFVNTTTAVHFNDYDWYIIADNSTAVDAGTVTLLAADTGFGTSVFSSNMSNDYSSSTVKATLDALTAEGGSFYGVKDAIEDTDLTDVGVTGAKLYLLSTSEAGPYAGLNFTGAQYGGWWLRSPGETYDAAAVVGAEFTFIFDYGLDVSNEYGVRPALKIDLSKVSFDTETKTFSLKQKAYADYDVTTDANKTKSGDDLTALQVKFNEKSWYIIEDNSTAVDAGTVTLLAADMKFGTSTFKSDESSKSYNSSDVKAYLESIVAGTAGEGKPNFSAVADAIKPVTLTTYEYRSETVAETTENAKLYLLSTEEAKKLSVDVLKMGKEEDMIYWWLRSPGDEDYFQQEVFAAMVYGEAGFVYDGGFSVLNDLLVRPALQLDLSKVSFDTETKTFGATAAASVATPTFTPAEGEYTSSQSVTISTTTEGAKIYFTVDGTEPTTSSQLYNALMPIDLPAENGTYTIKAIAVKDGMANSEIASATYIISSTTGIGETDADAAKSNIWYDLNGRHYQGKPTMQGVYINNRQKYVVK